MRGIYAAFGIAAPLVYFFAVVLGGLMRADYSHISNAISELSVQGAPNKALLDIIFSAYNSLIILFGAFAFIYLRKIFPKSIQAAMLMLSATGFLGILMWFFPMDARGSEITSQGIMHLVIAGLMSLLTVLTLMLAGIGFSKVKGFAGYSVYSTLSAFIVFITGGIAALSAATGSLFMGVYERFTIGTFLLWVLIISIKLYRLEAARRTKYS